MRRMALRQRAQPAHDFRPAGAQRAHAADASDDNPPHQHNPPLTASTCRVTYEASADSRNATAAATSSAVPARCAGIALQDLFHRHVLVDHVGRDQAGRDAVDRDLPLRQLDRERLGRADDAGLRGAVVDLATIAHHAGHRRQRHDPPRRAPPNHRHDHRLQHVVEGVEVGAEHAVPLLAAHRRKRRVGMHAGIADDAVVRAVSRDVRGERLRRKPHDPRHRTAARAH